MNDPVYPLILHEDIYKNILGTELESRVLNSTDRYYLKEFDKGVFGLHGTDNFYKVNAHNIPVKCPHHPARLVPVSDQTLVCWFCEKKHQSK